jgi:hypothetical protein
MAFTEAAREALWLRQLHRDVSLPAGELSADDSALSALSALPALPADSALSAASALSEDSAVYTVPIASDNHGALTTVHSEVRHPLPCCP